MELYIIRHGIAVERGNGVKDEERELTDEGRKKTQKVAQRLHELGVRFDLILTSPLVRARQTAEILQSTGLSSQLEESVILAPDGDIHSWLSWLERRQDISDRTQMAIVGHQPDLGQWVEILLWGEVRVGAGLAQGSEYPKTRMENPPRVGAGLAQGSEYPKTRMENPPLLVLKKAGIIGLILPETGSPVGRSQMFWLTPPKFLL